MPIYDAECPKCGVIEVWGKINEVSVCKCGRNMTRLISPTRINPDIQPYVDMDMEYTPTLVKSRQHRDQLLKEKGLYAKTNNRWF